jgi:5-methylcytosine-specific restriction enzyme subunit McrC
MSKLISGSGGVYRDDGRNGIDKGRYRGRTRSMMTEDLELRSSARRIARLLEENVSRVVLNSEVMRAVFSRLTRLTKAYESSLVIIDLLVQGQGISLFDQETTLRNIPGFLFYMNLLWEALLSRFLRENLVGYVVQDQHPLRNFRSYAREFNPQQRSAMSPRPDFAVFRGGKIVTLLDAKYRDIWTKGLPRDMLYQLSIYALSQGNTGQAIILYPVIDARATTKVIEIQNTMTRSDRASVILQPVNVFELEQLLQSPGSAMANKRRQYADELIFAHRVRDRSAE